MSENKEWSEDQLIEMENILFGGKTESEVGELFCKQFQLDPDSAIIYRKDLNKWKRVQAMLYLDAAKSFFDELFSPINK